MTTGFKITAVADNISLHWFPQLHCVLSARYPAVTAAHIWGTEQLFGVKCDSDKKNNYLQQTAQIVIRP